MGITMARIARRREAVISIRYFYFYFYSFFYFQFSVIGVYSLFGTNGGGKDACTYYW